LKNSRIANAEFQVANKKGRKGKYRRQIKTLTEPSMFAFQNKNG
jgi:hypothetical protein